MGVRPILGLIVVPTNDATGVRYPGCSSQDLSGHLRSDRSTHALKLFRWQIATGFNTKDHAYLTDALCVINRI